MGTHHTPERRRPAAARAAPAPPALLVKPALLFMLAMAAAAAAPRTAAATEDPFGFVVEGVAYYDGADTVGGAALGVVVPKPFIPNVGATAFNFVTPVELELRGEVELNLEYEFAVRATFAQLYWIMPTDSYWDVGVGFGPATVGFKKTRATVPVSDARLDEVEDSLNESEKVVRGRQAFTRFSVLTLGGFDWLVGLHRVEFDTFTLIAGDSDREVPSYDANMVTTGFGFTW